ncbi:MAG: helix-turn-helix domain-containing protein [Magnetococcales bacterium]|nr:helix-turn-helix domain-containing protein [Magnetococcales bacterium]
MATFSTDDPALRPTPIVSPEDLGRMIRLTRERANLTQESTAALLNLGRRFVGEVERGKPSTELGRVLKLLNGMGLDLQVVARSQE